jgi:TRAP-type C4-dicarboxylate transport system substrate-binding protein
MNFQDVYMALQTGTIDGQENPITQIHSARFSEVQNYISLTGHAYTPLVFVMNLAKFESLTPEQQTLIQEAAHEAAVTQREGLAKEQERRSEELAKTMTIIDDVDVEAFRAAVVEPVKADYVDQHGPELVDAIEKLRP